MAVKNFGIDLSAWNKITDYDKLIAGEYCGRKIKYAFLRIGYMNKVDTRFAEHYAGLSGKVYIGVYIYSYARSADEARAEARWVLDQIKELKINFPVVFDYEDSSLLTPKLSRQEYTAICRAFLDEIKSAGYYAMMYCNPNFLENYADKVELLKYPLWLAHYVSDGKQAQYGQKVWQFGTFKPAGAVGEIDANFAYERLGKVIRDGKFNVPKRRKITAVKEVFSWEIPDEKLRLKAQGYKVATE